MNEFFYLLHTSAAHVHALTFAYVEVKEESEKKTKTCFHSDRAVITTKISRFLDFISEISFI